MLRKANIVFELLAYRQPLCPQSSGSPWRVLQNVFEMGKCLAKYTFVNTCTNNDNQENCTTNS